MSSTSTFIDLLRQEIDRLDKLGMSKRSEVVIEGFSDHSNPRAIVDGVEYLIANSNDYLGLRHHPAVKKAEQQAMQTYGSGPGAVRFISGSLKVHRDLEKKLATFHHREDGMIFSSAFAANQGVLYSLIKGSSQDSLISSEVLVVSDALNHRSIIDGIRLAGLPKSQRQIFQHLNMEDLDQILTEHRGQLPRALVVTDGVFSMLGEYQDLKALRDVIDRHKPFYPQGILLVVDDCHGVGIVGETGRGVEEVYGTHADILVGTLGKAFGADGGYVVADQVVIDYLRESSATYIYSNNIAPGTAGAAQASLEILDGPEGKALLERSRANTQYFQNQLKQTSYVLAAPSEHPIQPVLIGDTLKTKALVEKFYQNHILVTNISYPVVAKGQDEIRFQISATHTSQDIDQIIAVLRG